MKKLCYHPPLLVLIEVDLEEIMVLSDAELTDEVVSDVSLTEDTGFTGGARSGGYRTSWPKK